MAHDGQMEWRFEPGPRAGGLPELIWGRLLPGERLTLGDQPGDRLLGCNLQVFEPNASIVPGICLIGVGQTEISHLGLHADQGHTFPNRVTRPVHSDPQPIADFERFASSQAGTLYREIQAKAGLLPVDASRW